MKVTKTVTTSILIILDMTTEHYLKENTNDVCFILTDVLLKILPIVSRLPKERKRDMAPRLSGCRK